MLLRVIALKNVLSGLSNAIAALGYALCRLVNWNSVLPLSIGLLIGDLTGPSLARRLSTAVLRVAIAMLGSVLALKLAFDAF
jgi:uncharacterized membrane protein YfcA